MNRIIYFSFNFRSVCWYYQCHAYVQQSHTTISHRSCCLSHCSSYFKITRTCKLSFDIVNFSLIQIHADTHTHIRTQILYTYTRAETFPQTCIRTYTQINTDSQTYIHKSYVRTHKHIYTHKQTNTHTHSDTYPELSFKVFNTRRPRAHLSCPSVCLSVRLSHLRSAD